MALPSLIMNMLPRGSLLRPTARHYTTLPVRAVMDSMHSRGFIYQHTKGSVLSKYGRTAVYCGFDPTADTLHVGNLVGIMGLLHFAKSGHQAIALVGGATGCIGDPSGRKTERDRLARETLHQNVNGIEKTLRRIFTNAGVGDQVVVVNNADWYREWNIIDFLGEYGRHFRMGTMLGKESVQSRLNGEDGMSFVEFTYQIFQAYDFYHLHRTHGCEIQIGGSDQWGNITAGCDLIRRASGESEEGCGITFPLITTSSGEKFGKSMGNAVWLDSQRTSPFDLYQFFIRVEDSDVERFLKLFTFMEGDDIDTTYVNHMKQPEMKSGQRRLAQEVTRLIHGSEAMEEAERATKAMYGGGGGEGFLSGMSANDVIKAFCEAPSSRLPREMLGNATVTDMLVRSGIFKSGRQAIQRVHGGGVYVNYVRVMDAKYVVDATRDCIDGKITLVRLGKKHFHVVHWE